MQVFGDPYPSRSCVARLGTGASGRGGRGDPRASPGADGWPRVVLDGCPAHDRSRCSSADRGSSSRRRRRPASTRRIGDPGTRARPSARTSGILDGGRAPGDGPARASIRAPGGRVLKTRSPNIFPRAACAFTAARAGALLSRLGPAGLYDGLVAGRLRCVRGLRPLSAPAR